MKRTLVTALALVMALGSAMAKAAESNWYAGGALGRTKADIDITGIAGSKDETDTGWKLFGGYQFNRHFGIEAGYVNLGSAGFRGTLSVAVAPFPVGTATSGNFDSKAWYVTGLGSIPVSERFSLFGKLGVSRADTDGTVVVGNAAAALSGRTTQPTYGLGLRFDVNKTFAVRGEWDRYRVGGGNLGDKSDVDLFSLNVIFKF